MVFALALLLLPSLAAANLHSCIHSLPCLWSPAASPQVARWAGGLAHALVQWVAG